MSIDEPLREESTSLSQVNLSSSLTNDNQLTVSLNCIIEMKIELQVQIILQKQQILCTTLEIDTL